MLKKIVVIVLIIIVEIASTPQAVLLAYEASESAELIQSTPIPTPIEENQPQNSAAPSSAPINNEEKEENLTQADDFLENLSRSEASIIKSLAEKKVESAHIKPKIRIRPLKKRTFKANEPITVVLENTQNSKTKIELFNSDGSEVSANLEKVSDFGPTVLKILPFKQLKAGKYRLKITDPEDNVVTQDFHWGVLAINSNKSVYYPNEVAKFSLAVLDQAGIMVCDAKVILRIKYLVLSEETEETLSTENGQIKTNPECLIKDYVEKPDYEAEFKLPEVGVYSLELSAETRNGNFAISDSLEVRNEIHYDIERSIATRIYPPKEYPVNIKIKANQDFSGTITETLPANFAVEQLEGVKNYEKVEILEEQTSATELEPNIVGLTLPFEGIHPISLGFGAQLRDPLLHQKYSDFGLLGHDGVDFDLPPGTAVLATDDGEVVLVDETGDYGGTVVIQHSWGKSYYGHLSKITTQVGTKKKRGFPIGLSGNTGLSTAPHLHFGIKPNEHDLSNGYYGKINPLPYFMVKNNNKDVLDTQGLEAKKVTLGVENPQSVQKLTWNISIKKGEIINIGYKFKSPFISPQFYLLGPLEFRNLDNQLVFQEGREWQLAIDADGSGTNTVTPNSGSPSTTGNTYTFTYTAAETMSGGGVRVTVPSGWSAPQASAGVAGRTTVAGNGNATVANVLDNADSETPASGVWNENDVDMCGNTTATQAADIVVDTTNKQEGTGSIQCASAAAAADNGDSWGFIYGANQNWSTACNGSSCTQMGYWIRAAVNTENARFTISSTTDVQAGELTGTTTCTLTMTAATTWEYKTCDLSGRTLTTVRSFGWVCTNNNCNPFDGGAVNIDEVLIGPGSPTFSGSGPWDINFRVLDAANTETFTLTYGSGGGTSGVTNSATETAHTFTTASRVTSAGTLTNIGSSPAITISSGPTLTEVMRGGKWFNSSGARQAFTF